MSCKFKDNRCEHNLCDKNMEKNCSAFEPVNEPKLTDTQKLAEIIHSVTCTWNHTDGCDWFYRSWDNDAHNCRKEYLDKAKKMLKITNYEDASNILKCLK